MHYLKPPLSFSQQAQRLNDHGLIINDINLVIERLSTVSYYRLSAYWHPFKGADDRFVAGTTFDQIWRRYTFDRHLRLLVMDAIERVEVAVLRTLMVEQFTLMYGPFGYRSITNYWPGCNQDEHNRLLSEIDAAFARSKETFVQHFRTKYTSEPHPPLWMMVEVMTYGQLFTMFRQLRRQEQKNIAVKMGIHQPVLDSWLHTLNYVRNVVAHHARLWNREMPIRPKMPEQRHRPEFYTPASTSGERMFGVLSLLRYLISRVAPQSEWPQRVVHLLDEYREIPLTSMGFPTNWRDYPLWKS
jgi:abortive infection bacteriophage resistance protein